MYLEMGSLVNSCMRYQTLLLVNVRRYTTAVEMAPAGHHGSRIDYLGQDVCFDQARVIGNG